MQSGSLKILALTLLLLSCQPAVSQITSHRLKTADSLFSTKKYTQSLEHYEKILAQHEYTPVMLLKMAFIEEGLLNIGQAMYYLNLYYLVSKDAAALEKMSELAQKYDLEGYDVEQGNFIAFYKKYHVEISLALGSLVLLFFVLTAYTRLRLKRKPEIAFSFLTLFAVALTVHLYFGGEKPSGIVTSQKTYLMSGPSSGAEIVDIIGDGHKLQVTGKNDVWLRIQWNNEAAYIKESALQPIRL